ncbi:MAG: hypothetical protein HC767_05250 [Akkermansiaceae bacterium]|nr:hypothetical protein [Akkermansiaceae bacterium]
MQATSSCGRRWPEVPSPLSAGTVKGMLDVFVNVLGADSIVKPDDLRGSYASLQAALQDKGADAFWPDVDAVRGKFFIIGGGTHALLISLCIYVSSCKNGNSLMDADHYWLL